MVPCIAWSDWLQLVEEINKYFWERKFDPYHYSGIINIFLVFDAASVILGCKNKTALIFKKQLKLYYFNTMLMLTHSLEGMDSTWVPYYCQEFWEIEGSYSDIDHISMTVNKQGLHTEGR